MLGHFVEFGLFDAQFGQGRVFIDASRQVEFLCHGEPGRADLGSDLANGRVGAEGGHLGRPALLFEDPSDADDGDHGGERCSEPEALSGGEAGEVGHEGYRLGGRAVGEQGVREDLMRGRGAGGYRGERRQASDSRPQTPGLRLQASDSRPQTPGPEDSGVGQGRGAGFLNRREPRKQREGGGLRWGVWGPRLGRAGGGGGVGRWGSG